MKKWGNKQQQENERISKWMDEKMNEKKEYHYLKSSVNGESIKEYTSKKGS